MNQPAPSPHQPAATLSSEAKALLTAEIAVEVPFHDVDSMEVVWHGHYVKYLELARCELLQAFDYNYRAMFDSGFAWPVVDMRLKYVKSARFGQRLIVRATLLEWEYRLKIGYEIRDAETGARLTKGHTVQIAVDMATEEMCYQSPVVLAERLGSYLAEHLPEALAE